MKKKINLKNIVQVLSALAIIMFGMQISSAIDLGANTEIYNITANNGHVTYSLYAVLPNGVLHSRNDYSCAHNKRAILWVRANGRDISYIADNLRKYEILDRNKIPQLYDVLRSYCK